MNKERTLDDMSIKELKNLKIKLQNEEYDQECDYEFTRLEINEINKLIESKQKSMSLIEKIAQFIINEVKNNTNDCQYIVDYSDIQEKFTSEIKLYIYNQVLENLSNHEEVADVTQDTDGFDVVLYTDFIPNYEHEEMEV